MVETGFEALQLTPELRGPVEPLDDHEHTHDTDHCALLYESQEEQFAAAIPFIRQGLERDEQCLYVAHENSKDEVLEAMQAAEIDVDAALESGALSVISSADSYLETGDFNRESMVSFWEDSLEQATSEEDYTGIRAAAEMMWAVESATDFDVLVEYEAVLNSLYEGEDYTVLCQYNRGQFPAAVIRDVISTHPFLIHNERISHNVYYTPPQEFFGPEKSEREIDRLLKTLEEQTDTKVELHQRQQFLQASYQITSSRDLDFEEKLEQLLGLGREWMGLNAGGLTHLSSWDDRLLNEYTVGYNDETAEESDEFWTNPSEGCYCRQVLVEDEPVGKADVRGTDWEDDEIHQEHGLACYLGTKVMNGSIPYGTLWVGSTEPRDREFSETERTFLKLIGEWVSYELERREHKQSQRKLYETVAATDLDTDVKIERLLKLGCDHLGLSTGVLCRDRGDTLEVQQLQGTSSDIDVGMVTPPSSEQYCHRAIETETAITVADAKAAGWDDDPLYEEVGLEAYAGVPVVADGDIYGTICFTDHSPRYCEFTESEQTFLELMGQCVSYELDRTHREEQLQQKNDRLESFASLLAHELRNPVTIGQIYSQQLPDETDTKAVEYVTEAFDRMEDIIDVMLLLTRGRDAIDERTAVEIADVAREVWADIDTSDAALTVADDQTIQADETYIRHLFRNLLENAVEHGGTDVTVTIGELDDGFYVADDGEGIPAEERDAVFDEGYTTAADNGGTGLGLAFIQKLAEVYDWDYTVTESQNGGAQFEFRNVL